MTLRLSFALTLLAVTPALAQPAPAASGAPEDDLAAFEKELDALFTSGGLTADQVAARATKVSPTVARSIADIDVAVAQAKSAELVRVPQVGATLSYNRLSAVDAPIIQLPGSTMGFSFPVILNNYSAQAQVAVSLSDYVFRYPKLIDAANLGMKAAKIGKQSAEIDIAQDARLAYWEWVRAELQVLIAKRQLAQVQSTLTRMRALAEAQRLSRADLMRMESNEAQAEQTLVQLTQLAELREEQVRILIDAPPGQPLTIGEDPRVDISAPTLGKLDELMDLAKKQRLDFRVLDVGISAKEKQASAEKANAYPKLSAFFSAEYSSPNQRIFPVTEDFNLTWVAGAQLSWTLNEMLYTNTNVDRLRAETNQLKADRENLERGTRVQIMSALQSVEVARAALATSQKGLAAAEESYRVRRELLNAQRATAVELVDAETELTRARIAALNARVDLRVALLQLEHALGNDVK
jgi:outer membrane protein